MPELKKEIKTKINLNGNGIKKSSGVLKYEDFKSIRNLLGEVAQSI